VRHNNFGIFSRHTNARLAQPDAKKHRSLSLTHGVKSKPDRLIVSTTYRKCDRVEICLLAIIVAGQKRRQWLGYCLHVLTSPPTPPLATSRISYKIFAVQQPRHSRFRPAERQSRSENASRIYLTKITPGAYRKQQKVNSGKNRSKKECKIVWSEVKWTAINCVISK